MKIAEISYQDVDYKLTVITASKELHVIVYRNNKCIVRSKFNLNNMKTLVEKFWQGIDLDYMRCDLNFHCLDSNHVQLFITDIDIYRKGYILWIFDTTFSEIKKESSYTRHLISVPIENTIKIIELITEDYIREVSDD